MANDSEGGVPPRTPTQCPGCGSPQRCKRWTVREDSNAPGTACANAWHDKEEAMTDEKRGDLPEGHMRVGLAIDIEGEWQDVTAQLVQLIKACPPEKQKEIGAELERRLHAELEKRRR
jgi:hypothetical protein